MVFPSIPAYLDPANWHQQQNHLHHLTGSTGNNNNISNTNHHLLPPPPPPPPSNPIGGGGGAGSIRPGSMADRARMANIPLPETQLKCPRCDSTNTKFCYFNNYSLTQPRHFCKTCRRYWTRGGALRNVPVGGGCRRNKRTKGTGSSASKSPASSSDRPTGSAGSSGPTNLGLNNSSTADNSNNNNNNMMMGLLNSQIPPLRFMSPFTTDMALNYGMGNNYGGGGGGVGEMSNFHQMGNPGSLFNFNQQQTASFPFLAGMETSPAAGGLFDSSGVEVTGYNQVRPRLASGMSISQMASVKMEMESQQQQHQSQQELNLSRQLLGMNSGSDQQHQYWSSNGGGGGGGGGSTSAWTELAGFSSTSATSNNINNSL